MLEIEGGLGDHPRMRGEKYVRPDPHRIWMRITPACAGKSNSALCIKVSLWDHPRMRGEKLEVLEPSEILLGSPPHARGKGQVPGRY